jgi:hypothetical protein
MKLLTILLLLPVTVSANVTCIETSSLTTCTNGLTAYQLGNMTQYNMPNGQNLTIWNSNINSYQEVPVQPIAPIAPIMPIDSGFRMFKPLK